VRSRNVDHHAEGDAQVAGNSRDGVLKNSERYVPRSRPPRPSVDKTNPLAPGMLSGPSGARPKDMIRRAPPLPRTSLPPPWNRSGVQASRARVLIGVCTRVTAWFVPATYLVARLLTPGARYGSPPTGSSGTRGPSLGVARSGTPVARRPATEAVDLLRHWPLHPLRQRTGIDRRLVAPARLEGTPARRR